MAGEVLTLSQHALDEVVGIVKDYAVSFDAICLVLHGLDLNALDDRIGDSLASKDAAQSAD